MAFVEAWQHLAGKSKFLGISLVFVMQCQAGTKNENVSQENNTSKTTSVIVNQPRSMQRPNIWSSIITYKLWIFTAPWYTIQPLGPEGRWFLEEFPQQTASIRDLRISIRWGDASAFAPYDNSAGALKTLMSMRRH